MDNVNRTATISLNLAGLKALSGNKKGLDKGYYTPDVADFGTATVNTRDGKTLTKVVFSLDFGGITRDADAFLPENANDKLALARWRGIAESFGYGAAQLDNGEITFSRDSFVGGRVHVYVDKKPANDGSGKEYDRISFLTPADWANGKAAEEKMIAAGGGVTVSTPAAAAPAVSVALPSVSPAAAVVQNGAAAPSAANIRAALGLPR